jgi:kynurenine formamidase
MGMSRFIDVSHPSRREWRRIDLCPHRGLRCSVTTTRLDARARRNSIGGTDRYFSDNPFLTAESCARLVAAGVAFVGIDSLNIDDIADMARPAHTTLLRAGVPTANT